MINLNNKIPRILVVGDLIIDKYLWGSCDRISPEAPVQIVNVENESIMLGGAGNVLKNLKSFGADADIMSVIGDCSASKEILEMFYHADILTNFIITQKNRKTSKKTRILSSQQQVVRFDKESTNEININSQNQLLKIFEKIVNDYDTVLLSDYGKGVLTYNVCQSLISIAMDVIISKIISSFVIDKPEPEIN